MFSFIWFLHIWILVLFTFCRCDSDLVKVIVLFRHGARTPLSSYKFHGMPDTDEKFWPEGYGKLTQSGKMQLFKLGQSLRRRYEDFIVPHSDSVCADLRVVSTESERCYQSAGFLLAGLYPPSPEQKWSEELNWQPVPILLESADRIKIIADQHLCPAYYNDLMDIEIKLNQSSSDVHYLLKFMSSHVSSTKIDDIPSLFFISDYFYTKLSMNLTLPSWIPEEVYTKLNQFYVESFNYLSNSVRMRRLLAGPLIKDIIIRIDETIYSQSKNSKFFLYSGHDSSLHSLGTTLGFEFKSVPYFGASFIFEIHRFSANDFRIKLYYSEDYSFEKLKQLTIPGCEDLCPVWKFIILMEKFIPRNWNEECTDTSNNS